MQYIRMGQSTSVSIVAKRDSTWKNEHMTRRLRYKRFREDANWCSNPPDGLDINHDSYKPAHISRELLDSCKAPPKRLFPEIFNHKNKSLVEEKPNKETLLQRLRRELLEESKCEREFIKAIKKQEDMLANLEKKWLKDFKVNQKKPETLSDGIHDVPKWFTKHRKYAKGVIRLSDLVQTPFPDTTNRAIENLHAKKLKLVLKKRKTDEGMIFKLSEKVSEGRSWKTNITFENVYITKANENHICLSGEHGLEGERVTFDLVIINRNNSSNSSLTGTYVRQTENDPHILTWIAKSN